MWRKLRTRFASLRLRLMLASAALAMLFVIGYPLTKERLEALRAEVTALVGG